MLLLRAMWTFFAGTMGVACVVVGFLVPMASAQIVTEAVPLPEGIAATGDTLEVRALRAWAVEHMHSRPEQAERVAMRALTLARELQDHRGIGRSLMILGNLVLASDLSLAETYFIEAREVFERAGDQHGLAAIQQNLGVVFISRAEFEPALTAFFRALEQSQNLGDIERQVEVLGNIAITHAEEGNLDEALVYLERAVALAETLGTPMRQYVLLLINLGHSLIRHGAYEEGEAHLHRAFAIADEQENQRLKAVIAHHIGYSLNEQGRHEEALPFLFTAEDLSNELGEIDSIFAVYSELAKAYMGLRQYNLALHYGNESLRLAHEMNSVVRQMGVHQTLSRVYEATGNPIEAFAHYREYTAAKDSVFNLERAEVIAGIHTRYETEEKQRTIERLEQQSQIQVLRQTLLLVGVGSLLLLLGFLYYRYRTKQKANRLLEELNAAKSRFFANISHEFRTPLTVILGGLDDMLTGRFGGFSGEVTAQHYAMLRNTRRLHRLIDEVLDLNRLESGHLDLRLAPGNLVRSIEWLVESNAPFAGRNGIALSFESNVACCPRVYDWDKLEKIVGNLLSNALKFTPEGGSVQVSLYCGENTEITVSDDGPGIPEDAQATIFERFVQLNEATHHGGTGIGLALAKELTEVHGGIISLQSRLGQGSTFTVRLPLEEAATNDIQPVDGLRHASWDIPIPADSIPFNETPTETTQMEDARAVGGDGYPESIPSLQTGDESDRTTVLIIEDDDDMRAYVRRSLDEVYCVLEAADGEAGLQEARSKLPDLIVSDVMLPGIDGYEVVHRLKAGPSTECIPVVMLTARTADADYVAGYGSGAETYLTKPFSPETLRAATARLLQERRRLQRRLQEDAKREGVEGSRSDPPTLIDRARTVILEHLHDDDFGVEELASTLGMSRSSLHHRLKQEVDIIPSDLIRTLRLSRAQHLLTNGAGSVSEVAYAVGFNSLVAFSRAYRTYYGVPPSAHLGREKTLKGIAERVTRTRADEA